MDHEEGSAIVPVTVKTALAGLPTDAVKELGLAITPEAPTNVCTDPNDTAVSNP
jgi:hypothetical protein